MENNAQGFWDWFMKNDKPYLFINEIEDQEEKDRLLDDFLTHLHLFCDHLFFEIGGAQPEAKQEVIITADGDLDYFAKVEELIACAPKSDDWDFIAFIPPREVDFSVEYEDLIIEPQDVHFLPLEDPDEPGSICIRLGLKNYEDIADNKWLRPCCFKLIDAVLGEKVFAEDIKHIEIDQLPDEPSEAGFLPLEKLPSYVAWHKTQGTSNPDNQ